ncbi:zinc finger protein ZAT1-like [Nicotiana tomentosiformis]|uniref:zinc finger protein ZAT1-like n=1 Tax=Nicotiana tomentosiformis TaxID=4098 RepID=UPI00051C95A5|nr:zinc finger protein ZAT1-like [Nicotiana tomentosiformis]
MVDNSEKNETISSVVHYCRVCKRVFSSAGALGGHMRSHGVGDTNRNYGEEISEQRFMINNNFRRDNKQEGQKHSYNLRANSNRLFGNRASEDRDRKSSMWPPNDRGKYVIDETLTLSPVSSPGSSDIERNVQSYNAKSEYYGYDKDQYGSREEDEDEDLANCLVMLSNKSYDLSDNNKEVENKAKEVEKCMFQCKACKKIFNSHQALGGHRASHKKVKGCYAAKLDDNNNNNNNDIDIDEDLISPTDLILHQESNSFQSHSPSSSGSFSRKRSRVHQCSICYRVFSSGQALGGHKRCHWLTSSLPETTFIPTFQEIQYHNQEQLFNKPMFTNSDQPLDLNFSAQLGNAAEVGQKLHNPFEHEGPRSYLQLWTDQEVDTNNLNLSLNQKSKVSTEDLSREENYKAKEAKLSNLKDVNLDGGSSWLQVGIGPTPDIVATL